MSPWSERQRGRGGRSGTWGGCPLSGSQRSSGPSPFLPKAFSGSLGMGRGLSEGLPSFPGRRHQRSRARSRSRGGVGDQLPSVLGSGVSMGCAWLSLILTHPVVWAPMRAEHPESAPSHFPFLQRVTFGRKKLWKGGHTPLHFFQGINNTGGSPKRGGQGLGEAMAKGGKTDRPAGLSSHCPSPVAGPQDSGWGRTQVSFSPCHLLLTSALVLTFPTPFLTPFLRVLWTDSDRPALTLTSCGTSGIHSTSVPQCHIPGSFLPSPPLMAFLVPLP